MDTMLATDVTCRQEDQHAYHMPELGLRIPATWEQLQNMVGDSQSTLDTNSVLHGQSLPSLHLGADFQKESKLSELGAGNPQPVIPAKSASHLQNVLQPALVEQPSLLLQPLETTGYQSDLEEDQCRYTAEADNQLQSKVAVVNEHNHDNDILNSLLDQRLALLAATLQTLEAKYELMTGRLEEAEQVAVTATNRLSHSEREAARLNAEVSAAKGRETALLWNVKRLETLLAAQKLQAELAHAERMQAERSNARLQDQCTQEKLRCERLRLMRDEAVIERDGALYELEQAMADMGTLHASLADSAVYVKYLRKRVMELELESSRQATKATHAEPAASQPESQVFNAASIRAAIQASVQEAMGCEAEERKKRIRQLQLRWHPDKNPVLTEFASEVTKMINEAVRELES